MIKSTLGVIEVLSSEEEIIYSRPRILRVRIELPVNLVRSLRGKLVCISIPEMGIWNRAMEIGNVSKSLRRQDSSIIRLVSPGT